MPTNLASPTDPPTRLDDPRTVRLSEAGAFDTMAGLERAGIAIVAELHRADDAEALAASRYGHRVTRVLIKPDHRELARARAEAVAIRTTLRAGGVTAPQFQPEVTPALAAVA